MSATNAPDDGLIPGAAANGALTLLRALAEAGMSRRATATAVALVSELDQPRAGDRLEPQTGEQRLESRQAVFAGQSGHGRWPGRR